MTTISTIIHDAYRRSNLIAQTATPSSAQETEALRLLNRFIESLIGNELGNDLNEISLGKNNVDDTDYVTFFEDTGYDFVPSNTRIVANLEAATTLNLDPEPEDGQRFAIVDASDNLDTYNITVNGNGRKIEDATSATLSTAGLSREWFYRADQSNWVRVNDLITTDDSPFPTRFDDLLISGLAMILAGPMGNALHPSTEGIYWRMRSLFKARYSQIENVPLEEALLRNQTNKRAGSRLGLNRFNKGLV